MTKETFKNAWAAVRFFVLQKPRICDCFYTKEDYKKLVKHRLEGKEHRPFGCNGYRITGFYKVGEVDLSPIEDTGDFLKDCFNEILNERRQELKDAGVVAKLVPCRHDDPEVEWVSGYGICGCIRPVKDIVVTSRVSWSEEHIQEEIDDNNLRVELYEGDNCYSNFIYTTEDGRIKTL